MMKDMTMEELLDDLCFYADLSDEHYAIEDELLRRFKELEKAIESIRVDTANRPSREKWEYYCERLYSIHMICHNVLSREERESK
jgi:hypothetical protein